MALWLWHSQNPFEFISNPPCLVVLRGTVLCFIRAACYAIGKESTTHMVAAAEAGQGYQVFGSIRPSPQLRPT